MIIGLRLGFIPRLRNDGKGIVYENGLGTFAHGVGIGHQSGTGMEELMKKQQEMMENFIKKFES